MQKFQTVWTEATVKFEKNADNDNKKEFCRMGVLWDT